MIIFLMIFINLICSHQIIMPIFDTYRAVNAYKNDDLESAQTIFDNLVTQDPDNCEALYNLGKIAYKKNNFEGAEAYFDKAVQVHSGSEKFQEQALFDLGNSQTKLKKWHEALKSFEDVLKINPNNEYAKKTLEQIKKIIEQEEQKKQEQEKKQQDQKKEQDKKDESQDKNEQQDSGNDKKQEQNKDGGKQEGQDQNEKNDQQSQQQKEQSDQKDNKDSSNDKNNKQQSNDEADSKKQERSQQTDEADKRQQQAERDKQDISHEKDKQNASVGNEDKKSEKMDYETMLLQEAENEDAAMSKKLLQSQLKKEMVRHGQKNW